MDNTVMCILRVPFVVSLVLVLSGCVSSAAKDAGQKTTPPVVAQDTEIPNPGIKDLSRFKVASRIVTNTDELKKMSQGVTFDASKAKKTSLRPDSMAILALSFSPYGLDANQSTSILYSVSVKDPVGKNIAQYDSLKLAVKVTKATEVVMVSPVRMIHRPGEPLGTYKVFVRGYDQTANLVSEDEVEFDYVN